MKKHLLYVIALICLPILSLSAQDRERIVGKIVSNTRELEGIVVQNITSGEAVETEKGGYFNIEVKEDDNLMFTAVHMIGVSYFIKKEDIKKTLLFISMERSNTVLDEIFIDRSINSVSLGFGKPLNYTPSQRNLITATTSGGGILPIDALVNSITGRTKMLRSAVEIEQESLHVKKLIDKFTTEYFTDYLKIPEKYISAFGYYIHTDGEVWKAVDGINKNYLDFVMSEKATQFLKIVNQVK